MTIYNHSGKELLNIEVTDESYRYRSIMQDNSVMLYYSLAEHVELPVGSYIEFQGERYTLWRPENFKKHGTRNFEYTVTFGGNQEVLKKYKFKLLSSVPYRLKFDLVAKPQMVIELLVDNLNLYDSGWSVGQCIEASEKALSFNHEFCYDVLNRLAQEFDTEWEIVGKTINFCKVEKFKDAPLALSYGKGNGFKTGVGRSNEGDKRPVSVLYVQGGERNIDFSKYRSKTLLLPKSQAYTYEGRTYQTDKEGMYITRADKPLTDVSEDSYDAGEIYPKRVGTISEVISVDAPNNLYDFIDKDIPDNLDYEDCLITGERMTIIFQSGQLAGKEFEVKYIHAAGNEKAGRRFEIVPQEIDGVTMPDGEAFMPRVGDTYAVFGIQLPDAYICDNVTQTGGSWEMFKEAVRYFYEHEEHSFTFSGELDGIWAKRHWLEIGGKIEPGGYVNFSDTQFQSDGVLIRITGVKDYINKPHSPSLELSNLPVSGNIRNDLGKIVANEVVVEKKHNDALQFTKRRYRDAKETMQMLSESLLNFSDAVNPIAIQTMQLLLGDKSLQFRFVDSKTAPSVVAWNITYNSQTKELTLPGVVLQHMTLGITEVKPVRAVSDYQFWDMASYGPMMLDEPAKKYYLYAKCSKDNQTGSFLPSERAISMEQISGYYHFLVGILNSEYEDDRSFAPLYGYTEILPGQITTDCIKSADGNTYFDLARNTIAGNIRFIASDGSVKSIADTDTLASEAKDKVAQSLGYTNYAALESAAQAGRTIINGGYIRTSLIDAEAVFTASLLANLVKTTELIAEHFTLLGGKLGYFSVDQEGLYYGDPSKWTDSGYKQNLASITPGLIKLQSVETVPGVGDVANIKVGIGENADPEITNKNAKCATAGYFYRQMNGSLDNYIPAVKIISDNVINRNIGLEVVGGLRVKGGVIQKGHFWNATVSDSANVIDLSFGTTICLRNSRKDKFQFFLPTLSQVRTQLGLGQSDTFHIPITVYVSKDNTLELWLCTANKSSAGISVAEGGMLVEHDGHEWKGSIHPMGAGDSVGLILTYTPYTGYYAQVLYVNS